MPAIGSSTTLAGCKAVEIDHRLVDPRRRRRTGSHGDGPAHQLKLARQIRRIDAARQQNDARPRRVEQQLLLALEFGAAHAGQRGEARLIVGAEVGGIAGGAART